MHFSVFLFMILSLHGFGCLLISMLVWLVVPEYPIFLIYLLLLLPFSIVVSSLFAQLFHFDGGPWSKSGGRWAKGLP